MTGAVGAAPRVSWVLLVVVVAALAVGAAATVLVNAAGASPPSSGPTSLIYLSPWEVTIASTALLVLFFGWTFVVMRIGRTSNSTLNRMSITALMAILLAVIFLVVIHVFNFGGALFGSGNSTGQPPPGSTPPPGSGGNGPTPGQGGVVTIPNLPAWVPFVILAGILLLVVLVAVPTARDLLEERRRGRGDASRAQHANDVRAALSQASADLDLGADPRETVLALYAGLLARLRPMAMEIDTSTPEEIRTGPLERLGVRPEAARTLTRLFEEARYSTHPMGAEAGNRARRAVRVALEDLDRSNRSP